MSIFKNIFAAIFGRGHDEPKKVIIVGLDAAGKTTILYKLRGRGEDVETTIPTIGFNVETLERRDLSMTCWDVGGCDKIRPLWRHYYHNMSMLMFVLDSNDRDRLGNASEELDGFLTDSHVPGNIPVLILANKQDLPNAMSVTEITGRLELHSKLQDRLWYICPCSAVAGIGIPEALQWMKHAFRNIDRHRDECSTTIPRAVVVDSAEVKVVVEEVADAKARDRIINRQTILDDWLRRAQAERSVASTDDGVKSADALFVSRVGDGTLDSWDHYTHIKLGYIVLSDRSSSSNRDFVESCERVSQLIQSYISQSSRTNGKSFHCTMTHFWCHMIHRQLCVYPGGGDSLVAFMESLHAEGAVDLWDGKLFSQYYSSGVMFGAEARAVFVAPDLQPFLEVY